MLVLTRKRDEFIKIGSNIVVRVIKTGNGSVKIGIDAPSSVRVMRGELVTVDVSEPVEMFPEMFAEADDDTMEECMLEAMLVQS